MWVACTPFLLMILNCISGLFVGVEPRQREGTGVLERVIKGVCSMRCLTVVKGRLLTTLIPILSGR